MPAILALNLEGNVGVLIGIGATVVLFLLIRFIKKNASDFFGLLIIGGLFAVLAGFLKGGDLRLIAGGLAVAFISLVLYNGTKPKSTT